MPYLSLKKRGNKSMALKRGMEENMYFIALQGLTDMVKAILPEIQFPVMPATSIGSIFENDVSSTQEMWRSSCYALTTETILNESI
jgi:hypothetical protein